MKGKNAIYILLPLVIIIWGLISYRLYSTLKKDELSSPEKDRAIIPSSNEIISPNFEISPNYRDPFLGKLVSEKKIAKQGGSKITPSKQKLPSPSVPWPLIKYGGIIKNQQSNSQLVLVTINGKENIMKVNQSSNDILLNKIYKDSIEVVFQKEKKVVKNITDFSEVKKEIEILCENKELWAWNEYNENKSDEAENLYNSLKEKNSTFSRFQDINYYGSKNAEIYMLYTHVLKKELPEYIKKVKEELGTKFVRFNERFKKSKDESFGDYVAKKLADSDDFYFSPDRVWREIESAKEEVLGQILTMAPTMQYQPHESYDGNIEEVIKEVYYNDKHYKDKGIIYENKRFP